MKYKTSVKKIKKRSGQVVDFDEKKITQAITKAGESTGEIDVKEARRLTEIVISLLEKANHRKTPVVEQLQDIVEQVLMAASYYQTAKAYIIYRKERADLRVARQVIGVEDDLEMSVNALKAMARRYLKKDERGNVVETPRQAIERVAKRVASVEKRKKKEWQSRFSEMLAAFEFVPAGCYFRGAGRKRGLLANCFVLPVEDDMGDIFDAVKWTALIHQSGGGTGYNFSHLRPKGDVVGGGGFASGPVSFMKAFDAATEIVMLGGRHRGANMGILNADHPDIFEFITCKTQEGEIANFNISIGASDAFMKAVEQDREWSLVNPRDGKVVQTVGARKVFDQAVALAWKTGDPGMIYLDGINKNNPLSEVLGPIEATNVCGEQPLHPFDVCNLGSINLGKFVLGPSESSQSTRYARVRDDRGAARVDWRRLERVVRLAVRFLDDGIDASEYPIPQIEKMAKNVRRIGLGVMGWADMLLKLRLRYDSKQGVKLAEKLMKFIQRVGWEESVKLAREKGTFPLWKESSYSLRHPVLGRRGKRGVRVRNVAVTTIAPTGTISMLADCSSGIEPVFALAYVKNVVDQQGMTYTNRYFEQVLNDLYSDGERVKIDILLQKLTKVGSVAHVEGVPKWVKEVFRTAHDIEPEWHVKMQAAFQKFTDNAVSKTINFPQSASIEDIEKAYLLAWKSGCKGITIYRDKSKTTQILEVKAKEKDKLKGKIQSKLSVTPLALRKEQVASVRENEEDRCPDCGGAIYFAEGCSTCPQCGYSKCEL
jgi:ribonucleoside-diphosphate reductase alpha chain